MSVSLYKMTDEYRAFLDYESEPTVDDTEAWNALLGELTDDIETKIIHIGYVAKTLDYEAGILRAEEKALAAKRRVRENKITRLKEYAFDGLKAAGLPKAQAVDIMVSIAKTPASLKLVSDDDTLIDDGTVPPEFVKTEKSIKRRELLAAVKENPDTYAGWAEAKSGETLRIR
ncbi:MAG: siphovirus Gp157 family protein [Planctomycetota bacterium]|nr:siphovirus Gp157 family protein [Planctomycetota bacterium]